MMAGKNDCVALEMKNYYDFYKEMSFIMNKGYKVSSTNCGVLPTGETIYQAILIKEV